MKIKPSRLFPHPVLWFINDDYIESDFTAEISEKEIKGEIEINYSLDLKNNELKEKIENGLARICIHIECSLTMFRYNHITDEMTGSIYLRQDNINHKIEVLPMIVANDNIENYNNGKLNEDYKEVSLEMDRGSILAISDYHYFIVDKEKNDIGRKESIFSIVKSLEDKPMRIESGGDRLIIKLNEKDFNNFNILQNNHKYKSTIFSMIIIPALIYALDEVANCNDEEFEAKRELTWFRSLEKCLNFKEVKLDRNTVRVETSYSIAQMLLEDPISDSLEFLVKGEEY